MTSSTPRLLTDSPAFQNSQNQINQIVNWINGTNNGGPNGDGRYPLTLSDGSSVLLPGAATNARTLVVDPKLGNDNTADGSASLPYKTMTKMLTVARPGDIVLFPKGCVIKEQWGMNVNGDATINIPLNYRAPDGVVFQNMDFFSGTWTNSSYQNVYSATINHSWGASDGSFAVPGQGFAPQMLIDQTRLIEMQLAASVDEDHKFATEADALAAVSATAGSFYVRGKNGSNMEKGWQSGDQIYFVHTPDGSSPAGHLVNYGNRLAPIFAEGSSIKGKTTIFGGVGHNGVIMRRCDVEDMEIWFPCHHASFVVGSHLKRCGIIGSNQTHGGYAYHDFGGSGQYLDCDTILDDCWVRDFTGVYNSVFGGHGTDDNVSIYVGRQLITNNFLAVNTNGIMLGGNAHAKGGIHRNMIGMGVRNVQFGDQFTAENCIFTPLPGTVTNSGFFSGSGSGSFIGGYTICARGDVPFHTGGDGTINFVDHHILFDGDLANNRWWQHDVGSLTMNFTRCVIESLQAADPLIEYVNGNPVLNFTDCHLSGIAPGTGNGLTVNSTGTIVGGRSGLTMGGDGKLASAPITTVPQLGSKVVDSISGFLNQSASVLTSKGLHHCFAYGIPYIPEWTIPNGVVVNGLTYSNSLVVIFGNGGALYQVNRDDPSPADVVHVTNGPGLNWIGAINGAEAFATSPCFLLASDGSLVQYDPSTQVFTQRTVPSNYPLRGGFNLDTNLVLAWGDNGVIISSNGGQSWSNSIANGDGTNVANYYNSITHAGGAHGQFFLWCKGGILLTSPTGASGSWVVHPMAMGQGYVRNVAINPFTNIGVGVVDHVYNTAKTTAVRHQSIIRMNCTNADPINWTIDILKSDIPALSKVVHIENYANGQNTFLMVGKVCQLGFSDDGRSMRSVNLVIPGTTVTSSSPEKNRIAALQPVS